MRKLFRKNKGLCGGAICHGTEIIPYFDFTCTLAINISHPLFSSFSRSRSRRLDKARRCHCCLCFSDTPNVPTDDTQQHGNISK